MEVVIKLWIISGLLSVLCGVSIASLTAAQLGHLPMDKTVSVVIILIFAQSCLLLVGIIYASLGQRKLERWLKKITSA